MTDDPAFYWMDLEPLNVADLARSLASTLSETEEDGALYGIVSEADGGIIAYAIGEDHAKLITDALLSHAS